jgi:site-specific DNA recombinase
MEDMLTREYDGCGRCLVAVRRLSRKTDRTSSPQRQGNQDLKAAADAGGTSSRGPMTGKCRGLRTR